MPVSHEDELSEMLAARKPMPTNCALVKRSPKTTKANVKATPISPVPTRQFASCRRTDAAEQGDARNGGRDSQRDNR
ncbi:MAG: hypothetical protein R3E39_11145 [Anaerolineae bacterium]